jgi:hypothetical protein
MAQVWKRSSIIVDYGDVIQMELSRNWHSGANLTIGIFAEA